jgi:hypothetical protein
MPGLGVIPKRAQSLIRVSVALAFASLLVPASLGANGGDLPSQVVLQGFIKPEEDRLQLLVRIPLVLLASFGLPKRGPGYLDLARIDNRLRDAAGMAGRQIEVFEDGRRLVPATGQTRVATASDRSFESYASAWAHLHGPPLPVDTDLYWNQGFLDAELAYPIRSSRANFSVRVNVAPELGQRLTLHLEFLSAAGPVRRYDLPGRSPRVSLDPRWFEAAGIFGASGFTDAFVIDRLLFLLCLVAPFRRFWSLLAVVMAMTGVQTATLTAGAPGAIDWRGVEPLLDTGLAAAVLLLAIDNVVAPSLRRRWVIASVVGVVSGFGVTHRLADDWQFAGAHAGAAAVSFIVGGALGTVVSLGLAHVALGLLFTYATGRRLGVIVLSAILGHQGWHWMMDGAHRFQHAMTVIVPGASGAAVAGSLLLGGVVGAAAWFLPRRFDGPSG